jgi:hypothetical protein
VSAEEESFVVRPQARCRKAGEDSERRHQNGQGTAWFLLIGLREMAWILKTTNILETSA